MFCFVQVLEETSRWPGGSPRRRPSSRPASPGPSSRPAPLQAASSPKRPARSAPGGAAGGRAFPLAGSLDEEVLQLINVLGELEGKSQARQARLAAKKRAPAAGGRR